MSPALADLIDTGRLAEWMDGLGLDGGPITALDLLAGGSQNVVVKLRKGGRDFVLRRPPASLRPESNETMRREARVLGALAGTAVPHPRLIASCGDESVLGAAFYLMEPVDGFSAIRGLPALHAGSAEIRHHMGLALVDGAAAMGRVDHIAVGLDGFGKPANFLERQINRWRSQLEGYARHAGWPGAESLPGERAITDYLESNLPKGSRVGLLHGDYSIGNVMYRPDGPELAAIVDWELATIGDPLLDLAWILATWRSERDGDLGVLRVEPFDGFPTPDELIERYAAQSDRDLSAIDWYVVLACYKLAVVIEGTFARACAGLDPMPTGIKLHDTAVKLFQRALKRIG